MDKFADLLCQGASELGLSLDTKQVEQFRIYCAELIAWNEKINLTTIIDPEEIAVKHFIDSLALLKVHRLNIGARVIDIGTGAGFPGIPLKIVRPDLTVLLLDSLQKRTKFLHAITEQLGLELVTVVHGRAEELGHDVNYRELFDVAVSRAVAPLNILAEFCLPFVRLDGYFLSLKGPEVNADLAAAQSAINILGGTVHKLSVFSLPISGDSRSLVMVKKTAATPDQYPRRAGRPEKKPLK